MMSQPQTICDIIENLEEQKRLLEILLQEGISAEVLRKLSAMIVSVNDRTQILLDTVVGHGAVRAAGKIGIFAKIQLTKMPLALRARTL
jgi:hypothetical protein